MYVVLCISRSFNKGGEIITCLFKFYALFIIKGNNIYVYILVSWLFWTTYKLSVKAFLKDKL